MCEEEAVRVYAKVLAEEYYEQEPDPNDQWDSGTRALRDISIEVGLTTERYGYDITPAADGTVCVLVEHYSDGCTFGSYENAEVKGVFTDEVDARLFANSVNKDHGYFGSHIDFLYFTEKP